MGVKKSMTCLAPPQAHFLIFHALPACLQVIVWEASQQAWELMMLFT